MSAEPEPTLMFLLYVQVALLGEMESYTRQVQGCAGEWCESVEQMLTEELDSRLRAHRPRAGVIEEEVRRQTVQCIVALNIGDWRLSSAICTCQYSRQHR